MKIQVNKIKSQRQESSYEQNNRFKEKPNFSNSLSMLKFQTNNKNRSTCKRIKTSANNESIGYIKREPDQDNNYNQLRQQKSKQQSKSLYDFKKSTIRAYKSSINTNKNDVTEIKNNEDRKFVQLISVVSILPRKQTNQRNIPSFNTIDTPNIPCISNENLYKQNIQLKANINSLNDEISRLKFKIAVQKRQTNKLNKDLNLENDYYNLTQRYDCYINKKNQNSLKIKPINQTGFHPVNYMITGIKLRYQQIKQDYQKQTKQMIELRQKTQVNQIQELEYQIKILQKQNKNIISKLQQIYQILNIPEQQINERFFKSSRFDNIKVNQYKIQNLISPKCENIMMQSGSIKSSQLKSLSSCKFEQANNQTKILILANNELKQTNSKLTAVINSLNLKIQSQELLIDQKLGNIQNLQKSLKILDNEANKRRKQVIKALKRQKQSLLKFQEVQKLNKNIQKHCTQQISKIKQLNQKLFIKQRQIFFRQIQERNVKITKLEKQVSYLSTLLKYWKPLQQNNKSSSVLNQYNEQAEESKFAKESPQKNSILISNRKRSKTKVKQSPQKKQSPQRNVQEFKLGLKSPVTSQKVSQFSDSEYIEQEQVIDRQPLTSRKKHSENGTKVRKINPSQIQYLKLQIKYRCMIKRLSITQIKNLFQSSEQQLQKYNKKEQFWKRRYITMKQLKHILIKAPFCLTNQQSHKLSRFVVEDTSAQFIYCDHQNQIQREIVKSVIKAFIQDYQLPDQQRCKLQLENVLKMYGKNLRSALNTLAQNGKISSAKLFGMMQSLQIPYSAQLKDYIIARLYSFNQKGDRNIDHLNYELIWVSHYWND